MQRNRYTKWQLALSNVLLIHLAGCNVHEEKNLVPVPYMKILTNNSSTKHDKRIKKNNKLQEQINELLDQAAYPELANRYGYTLLDRVRIFSSYPKHDIFANISSVEKDCYEQGNIYYEHFGVSKVKYLPENKQVIHLEQIDKNVLQYITNYLKNYAANFVKTNQNSVLSSSEKKKERSGNSTERTENLTKIGNQLLKVKKDYMESNATNAAEQQEKRSGHTWGKKVTNYLKPIKRKIFVSLLGINTKQGECPICSDKKELFETHKNGHYNCHDCLTKWIEILRRDTNKPTCPQCRADIKLERIELLKKYKKS